MWGGSGCQAGVPQNAGTVRLWLRGSRQAVAQVGATDWNLYDEGRGER